MDKRVYWMWLVLVFGTANERIWKLSGEYDSADDFCFALKNGSVSNLLQSERDKIGTTDIESAETIINQCEKNGIDVYCYESEGFPERLRKIANPPAILFCRGNLDFLNNSITAGVVGTRTPSEYSVKITDKLCGELCKRGCLLVTGIADGIDQIANRAFLNRGVATVGVCGREIDSDYPAGSGELKNQIAEKGAVVSETCLMMNCRPMNFSLRNRILVGLADAVIFIECSEKSKGLDNASHAIYQGKQIFVVPPHDISDSRYGGQVVLLRQGCKPIFSAEDFVYYVSKSRIEDFSFDRIGGAYSTVEDSSMFVREAKPAKKKNKRKKSTAVKADEKEKIQEKNQTATDISKLSEFQAEIYRLISQKPMLADTIADKLNAEISQVLAELTVMELDGTVKSLPGKMFGTN